MLPASLRRLVALSLRFPSRVVFVWFGTIAAGAALASGFLRVDTGTNTFLDRGSAKWQAYQQAVRDFGGDEYVAISIRGKHPYDWDLLSRLPALSADLKSIPGVRRVDSLATVPLIRSLDGGGVDTRAALEGNMPDAASERAKLISHIDKDLVAERFLISDDGRYVAINVMLDRRLDADRSLTVERIRQRLGELPAALAGVPIFRTEVNKRTQAEVALFVPATVILIAGVAYLWIRSALGVLALLAVGTAGSSVVLAAMAVTNVPLSLSTMLLPSVLLAIGCAYAGHVVIGAARSADGVSVEGLADAVIGIAWSGVTTAIGFAAMSTTTVDSIRQLAAYGSLGVFVVAGAAISLAPALLALGRRGPVETQLISLCGRFGNNLAVISVRNRGVIITVWIAITAVIGLGSRSLAVDTNIIRWFGTSDPIRQEYEAVRDQFSGITPVSVVLRASGGRKITEPEVLEAVEGLRRATEHREVVGRALAVTQPLQAMRGAFGRNGLPEATAEAEQYLLLLDSSDQLSDLISRDRRSANIWLRLDSNESGDIVGMGSWVEQWWGESGVEGVSVETTGVMYEFARAQDAIAGTQIRGLAIAVIAVGIVLCVALSSISRALLAIVPNALPIALAFGGMGLLGVPIDAATVCLGSLALGIAVDDTVHVMLSLKSHDGVNWSVPSHGWAGLGQVAPALVLTTVCIALGFGVLGASSFTLVRNLGVVTSVVVVVCLAADMTLLPALACRSKEVGAGLGARS